MTPIIMKLLYRAWSGPTGRILMDGGDDIFG